ncbi:MAG TPA: hypothetical protein VN950_13685 [Terriglobales bacterium]|nr:hypothetical protein [Terriglobales bacterium]
MKPFACGIDDDWRALVGYTIAVTVTVVRNEIAGFNALGAAALSVGRFARQYDEKKGGRGRRTYQGANQAASEP